MNKKKKKRKGILIWIILALVLLAAAAVYLSKFLLTVKPFTEDNTIYGNPPLSLYLRAEHEIPTLPPDTPTDAEPPPYVSPIDFEKLRSDNEDTCAWLEIPETILSFPIVQHPTDNSFYLNHIFDKSWSTYGAVFIEDLNNKDFNDNVTLIYGHKINDGKWFGELQPIFTDPEKFEKSKDLKLYLPNEERTYRVFAAVPHDNSHILRTHDFCQKKVFDDFIASIADCHAINSIVDRDSLPSFGTKVIILSTCLSGDRTHRFLLLAAETET